MYKNIFVVVFLFLSFSGNAQISMYGSAGINSIGISQSDQFALEKGSYLQPFLTFGVNAPVNNKLSWIGEISYSPTGYELKNDFGNTKIRYKMLNIQSGFEYKFGAFSIEAGGFIGANLSTQSKIESRNWTSVNNEYTKNYNVGAFVGLKWRITDRIDIFARYYKGFTPISKLIFTDANGNNAGIINEKIRNFQFGATFKLF